MNVVRLSDAHDPERFGAKAATLAELASRYRVPPGFAVAADASEDEIRAAVPAVYAAIGDAAVAVRSSAIGEDSRDASFAGQHETLLNVRGADAVIEAILDVRRSAMSERAVAYRRERGIADAPHVGVLVQCMVDADAAVIAFTADPVTGDADLITINACRGLGDAMASGEITPDMVQVRKADLEPLFDGTREAAVLTAEQIREVAQLAVELERGAGHAVDIEAAFADGVLYLLQSRPVTAAGARADTFPVTWPEPGDEQLSWTLEDAHFAAASKPLSLDYSTFGPAVGLQRRNDSLGLPMRMRWVEQNGWFYVVMQPQARPEEVQRRTEEVLGGRLARAKRLVSDWPAKMLPAVDALLARMRSLRPDGLGGDDAAVAWETLWACQSDLWEIHMQATGGSYGIMGLLGLTYAQLTGRAAEESFALVAGRARTLQKMQRDMFTLSETVRALPHVAEAVRSGVERVDVLRDLPGGERFGAAIDRFLEAHGDCGQTSEQLTAPAWRDEPELVVREVRRALDAPPSDPDVRLARLLAEGEALMERVRAQLRDRPEDLARWEELVEVAREAGPITEEHNYWIDRRGQAHMRRAVLAFGARLVADGTIENADDILYFYVSEVADALRRPRDLRGSVREREARHVRNLRRKPPSNLGAPPKPGPRGVAAPGMIPRSELGFKQEQDDSVRDGVLKGVAASAGVARGPARLVRSVNDLAKVRAGDVLVCHASQVSYVPVYGKVAAVVTEVGGSLSHAAVVAREFGVPCVTATSIALSVLRDGEDIEVDGSAGAVRRVASRVSLSA